MDRMFEQIDGWTDVMACQTKDSLSSIFIRQKHTISRLQSECKEKDNQLRTLTLTSIKSYPEVSGCNVRIRRSKCL